MRRVALFYIFSNLINAWLNRRQLSSHLLLHAMCCSSTHHSASGKLYHILTTERENNICYYKNTFDPSNPQCGPHLKVQEKACPLDKSSPRPYTGWMGEPPEWENCLRITESVSFVSFLPTEFPNFLPPLYLGSSVERERGIRKSALWIYLVLHSTLVSVSYQVCEIGEPHYLISRSLSAIIWKIVVLPHRVTKREKLLVRPLAWVLTHNRHSADGSRKYYAASLPPALPDSQPVDG